MPAEAKNALEAMVADPERALMMRAAWLYFLEERTQSDIADALGLTRFRVNRLLADCREKGLVRINITGELADCAALEEKAIARFGLRDAVIVPTPAQADGLHSLLGAGAARYMSKCLADPQMRLFGIGWGQTMREMLRFIIPQDRPDAHIVTLLGNLPHATEENSIEIIGKIGRMIGAERSYMTAPIYADTPEARNVIASQQFFTSVLDLVQATDVALFAVGDMSRSSLLIRHALPAGVSAEELMAAGAVGDILGTFIARDGTAIDHPINRQLLGPGLADLKTMKSLVLASGGTGKVDVIAAALRSGLIDVLVTDEVTIAAVFAQAG